MLNIVKPYMADKRETIKVSILLPPPSAWCLSLSPSPSLLSSLQPQCHLRQPSPGSLHPTIHPPSIPLRLNMQLKPAYWPYVITAHCHHRGKGRAREGWERKRRRERVGEREGWERRQERGSRERERNRERKVEKEEQREYKMERKRDRENTR